ncbi:Rv2175c family DNA-binding protein [Streptomyces fildesensis]|uniref:Rv2175c family DNA-binding protein n=1 Tax=Streptomyces fildesensis TaxID=375757 RepID=A0ABW8CFM4_9ACTN
MTEIDATIDALVPSWLNLPEVAERLGVPITRVRPMIKEKLFLAIRRGENRVLMVPADFIGEGSIVKGLPGLLTVLKDNGFSDEEVLEWLFTADPTLPGTPVQALKENRGTEVKRRAQALAF